MNPMNRLSAFLYGLAPTSALVCSAEGDPPGDGGGPTPPQPPPAPATPAGPPQFTPEQQAWIQQETERKANAAAANARRAEQERHGRRGEQPPPQPPASTPPQQPPVADPAQVYTRLRAFDRAVDRYDLADEARGILEADFNTANPPDPAAWVTQRAAAFGWRTRGQQATATPTPSPATAPSGTPAAPPPAQPPGSPPARTITADTPIWQLNREDQSKLARQIGPFEFKKRLMSQLAETGQRFSLRR